VVALEIIEGIAFAIIAAGRSGIKANGLLIGF